MQLVLDTKGLIVSQRNQCFQIQHGDTKKLIAPTKITSIAVTTNCLLSTSALILAAQHQIPIYFVDAIGQVHATSRSANFESISTIRRKQVFFCESVEATTWVCKIFSEKNTQALENLRWLLSQANGAGKNIETTITQLLQFEGYLRELSTKKIRIDDCRSQLLGKEGSAARSYWETLSKCLPQHVDFENRTRRPATDAFNAALNYLYGMLYTQVENALWSAGLDPYLGVFHVDEYNTPTLAFVLL